ncbi:MAG: hypothetical protein ACI9W4_002526 [Rhodothermales bacterium]|jgi:hypothetical protein
MNYLQLLHAIRATCNVVDETELWVFGSQAILGTHPQPSPELTVSLEVDIQPKHQVDRLIEVDGVLGEGSPFHELHGFYVHGVSIELATVPSGWQERCIPVSDPVLTNGRVGFCLEANDLALSKLAAYRDKDRRFVRRLISDGLVDCETMLGRVPDLPAMAQEKDQIRTWLQDHQP